MNRLGDVRWMRGNKQMVAYLNVDGTWDVPGDGLLSKTLGTITGSDLAVGPESGPFGPAQLQEVAEMFGGKATVYPREPAPEGVAY